MTDNIFNRIESGGSEVHDEINLICDVCLECLEFSPSHTKALEYKADVIKQYPSRFNEAIILYRQILQITPRDTTIMKRLAESLLDYPHATEVDRKEAIVLYKTCIKKERGYFKSLIMYEFAELISKRKMYFTDRGVSM